MKGSKFWDKDDISPANPARFDGAGWYRQNFEAEKKTGKRYRLEFRGVRERARVWLNGKQVAMHEGLGAPFSIDVTIRRKALVLSSNLFGDNDITTYRSIERIFVIQSVNIEWTLVRSA